LGKKGAGFARNKERESGYIVELTVARAKKKCRIQREMDIQGGSATNIPPAMRSSAQPCVDGKPQASTKTNEGIGAIKRAFLRNTIATKGTRNNLKERKFSLKTQ